MRISGFLAAFFLLALAFLPARAQPAPPSPAASPATPPADAQAKPAATPSLLSAAPAAQPAVAPVTEARPAPKPRPKARAAKASYAFGRLDVELPSKTDEVFPDGRGSELLDRHCLTCHSADTVMNQPALPAEVWRTEVLKMRDIYKAPIADEDMDGIVAYLETVVGLNREHWR
jgi:mono/diheme cytochrome c family protein